MKNRSRIDIMSQILEIANGGNATKTKIMYKALVSYNQLNEYLMHLTEKDLLRYEEDSRTFKTTEKGLRFLDKYNQIDEIMKERQSKLQM